MRGYRVLGIILEIAAGKDLEKLDNEIDISRKSSKLTREILEDARLGWFGENIRIIAAITKAWRQRAEGVVDKLCNLIEQRLVGTRGHGQEQSLGKEKMEMRKGNGERGGKN